MFVTALQPNARRKSRLDVYLDGIVAGEVSKRTARDSGLWPGRELSREQFAAIVAEDQRQIGVEAAVAMLARRPRSERDIRRRLKQRRLDDDVIETTVGRLREAKLLDDAEYARSFAESRGRTSPRSQRLIVQELRAAGVDGALAAAAVAEQSDEDAAYRLAQARMRNLSTLPSDAFRSRLTGLLQRRGFGWDVTRATVERCWREVSESCDSSFQEQVGA